MLRVAITGAGYISKIHARALCAIPEVELIAVVERFKRTAQPFMAEFGIPDHYKTIDELLAHSQISALVVGTPNYLHAPQSLAALQLGVHVMVEKPMAMNARQSYQMLAASQRSGAFLMVAHCWRFDPEVLWLKEQLDSGRLGNIIRTRGYGIHESWGPSGWFTRKKFAGGGALADVGIHALDTARFLLGDPQPVSVYARIGTHYGDYDVDDTGVMLVNWSGGETSYIESGWWQPHTDGPNAATQVYGERGFGQLFPTFIVDRNGKYDPGYVYPRQYHAPQSLYDDQMKYFIRCIRQHTPPYPGGTEGWVNMKVVDAAYRSGRSGRVVIVD